MTDRNYYNPMRVTDYGPKPYIADFESLAKDNPNYLTIIWTGNTLQVGVMDIPHNTQSGAHVENITDQMLRITDGIGWIELGKTSDKLELTYKVRRDEVFMIPAGTWYNFINKEDEPLKLFNIYAPPKYSFGTVVPKPKPTPLQDRIDQGPKPYALDINKAARENKNFLETIWTGTDLQVSLMSIPVGGEVSVRVNEKIDEYIGPEVGVGLIMLGDAKDHLPTQKFLSSSSGAMIPAGTWYKIVNVADHLLKLIFVSAPPAYPHGTVQKNPII